MAQLALDLDYVPGEKDGEANHPDDPQRGFPPIPPPESHSTSSQAVGQGELPEEQGRQSGSDSTTSPAG
jgi:hypothetical protein